MLNAITNFFASPEDKDPNFIRLTRNILIFALIAVLAMFLVVISAQELRIQALIVWVLTILSVLLLIALLLVVLRGEVGIAKMVIPIAFIAALTVNALGGNSIHDISMVGYPLIIVIGTLLQDRRSLVITVPLTLAAIALLGIFDWAGLTSSPLRSETDWTDIAIIWVLLGTTTGILNLLVRRLRSAVERARANEQAQIEANQELKNLQTSLEQRVQERTLELTMRGSELAVINQQIHRRAEQLEALAQVMQTITSVRDLQKLLPQITAVISEKFGFYHVGVFLIDDAHQYAILSAANSVGGSRMLERRHRLRVGEEGIVGYVTSTGEPRIAMDVGKDPVFFNNPDLPETHSEMALPLKSGDLVMGALDVQSTETGAFQDEDVQMLSLLANQVSLAIENARLFDETRTALAEAEAISRQFTREAWGRLPAEHNLVGYRYDVAGAIPLNEPIDLTEQARGKSQGKQTEASQIVVPIELRGETIGNLVVQSPSAGRLNQDQLDLIKAVAERVALSAENARLFEETTRRAERERLVSDITGKIRSMNDPQTMIQTAMEELRKALGATRVDVIPQAIKGVE
ncbi:MAG TPA: GAF domain-containing protein [Anaerolineales bacterium]|nr:GAF domain-containing protein [Anaerolineales bacterium]